MATDSMAYSGPTSSAATISYSTCERFRYWPGDVLKTSYTKMTVSLLVVPIMKGTSTTWPRWNASSGRRGR